MKHISFFTTLLFFACSTPKRLKKDCLLSPVSIVEAVHKEKPWLAQIPKNTTYFFYYFGFKDTMDIRIGDKFYKNVPLFSHPISDVVDVEHKVQFSNDKPISFEMTTKTCRIRLLTEVPSGYKYIVVHYYRDTFRLNCFK